MVDEDPSRRFLLQRFEPLLAELRSEEHLDELLGDLRAQLVADRAVEHDDGSVGGEWIRRQRTVIRLLDRARHGDAGRVRVLDDDAARHRELHREQPRCGEVAEVVERELAPVQLADTGEQVPPGTRLGVVRRALVWVLAVDEVGDLDEARGEGLRERVDVAEPARDRRLVGRRGREGLGRENAAGLAGDAARLAQLGEDRAVALGLAHGRDVREVLGRRTQHGRAADVDHLDRVLLLDTMP